MPPTNSDAAAAAVPKISRWIRYLRHVEGADFSLEANTESVPEKGHFYLLRAGSVLLRSDDFPAVEAAYRDLCREHWEGNLMSEDRGQRMASAWGLVGMEPAHPAASAVIQQDGSIADHARLTHVRNRQRAGLARRARYPAATRG